MAIIDLVQRTDPWAVWRKLGVTASMIPIIMGISPYQTKYELWAELVGLKEPADLSNNWHVQRGVEQEPEARATIENQLGKPFIPVCVEADHNTLFKASLDGLFKLNDLTEVLEIKCPCEKIYRNIREQKGASENFQMYTAQVQWQLNCSGAQVGFLYFYLRGERPIKATIKRNQAFIDKAEIAALEFWDLVQTKTPPARIEGRDKVVYEFKVDTSTDPEWISNVENYKAINSQIKKLEEQLTPLKDEAKKIEIYFQEKIPSDAKTFDKDGIRATKCDRDGKIDNDAFLADLSEKTGLSFSDLIDLQDAHRAKGTSFYRVGVSNNSNVQTEQPCKVEKVEPKVVTVESKPVEVIEPKKDSETQRIIKPLVASTYFSDKAKVSAFF